MLSQQHFNNNHQHSFQHHHQTTPTTSNHHSDYDDASPEITEWENLALSVSHLLLPHSESLIQTQYDLTKAETRTLQTACAILYLLAHFIKNRDRYVVSTRNNNSNDDDDDGDGDKSGCRDDEDNDLNFFQNFDPQRAPIEIEQMREVVTIALRIPKFYMHKKDLIQDKIKLRMKLSEMKQSKSLFHFHDETFSRLFSVSGTGFVTDEEAFLNDEVFEEEDYSSEESPYHHHKNNNTGDFTGGGSSQASILSSSNRNSMMKLTSTTNNKSSSLFSSTTSTMTSGYNRNHSTHQVIPTRSSDLTKILNGGLRVGNVIEVCCGRKVQTSQQKATTMTTPNSRRDLSSSPALIEEKLTADELRIHSQEFDSAASILTALTLIPSSSAALTAVLCLSERAVPLFQDCFASFENNNNNNNNSNSNASNNNDQEDLLAENILFEKFIPGSGATNGERTLLEFLPSFEAKLMNTSEMRQKPLKMLMLLDLDDVISNNVTSVDVVKNRNDNSSSSINSQQQQTQKKKNYLKTYQTDSLGDLILTEMKKFSVRQNVAVVVVRLKDTNDLIAGSSTLLTMLSNAFAAFGGNSNNTDVVDAASSLSSHNNSTNNSANVASYHAVNCRLRVVTVEATKKNKGECMSLEDDAGKNSEESSSQRHKISVEVCKSAWCGTSISSFEI